MQKDSEPPEISDATTRSRGRPRAFDRTAALSQATHLFWRKGYEATSIADLTAAMGIGSPSLYAAFGSKEALYVEALGHYQKLYEGAVWDGFTTAETARGAVEALLLDSAAALTGAIADTPRGCMATLSFVGCDSGSDLSEGMRAARSVTLDRIEHRIRRAIDAGELSATLDVHALARFVQTMQSGMSILARDGATRPELEGAARIAMRGWDAYVERGR